MIRRLGRVLRYAWAMPASAVGVALLATAACTGATIRIVSGVVEVAGGGIDRVIGLLPRRCRFNAITLGHVIIGTDHPTLDRLRRHEHVHVRQYERWGALFFLLYLASSLTQLVRGRDPYLNNRFEREAFAEAAALDSGPTRPPRAR